MFQRAQCASALWLWWRAGIRPPSAAAWAVQHQGGAGGAILQVQRTCRPPGAPLCFPIPLANRRSTDRASLPEPGLFLDALFLLASPSLLVESLPQPVSQRRCMATELAAEGVWGDAAQRMLDHLNMVRAQQAAVVDEACRTLESIINGSAYLRDRLASVTVESHSKALYSLHRCFTAALSLAVVTRPSLCRAAHRGFEISQSWPRSFLWPPGLTTCWSSAICNTNGDCEFLAHSKCRQSLNCYSLDSADPRTHGTQVVLVCSGSAPVSGMSKYPMSQPLQLTGIINFRPDVTLGLQLGHLLTWGTQRRRASVPRRGAQAVGTMKEFSGGEGAGTVWGRRKLQASGMPLNGLRDVAQVRVVLQPRQAAPPPGTSTADHLKDQNQLCYNVMGLVPPPSATPPPLLRCQQPAGVVLILALLLALYLAPLLHQFVHCRNFQRSL